MSRTLYRLVTDLAEPALKLYLRRRARRGKEDPARLDERLGRASVPRPAGRLAWLHAASVGEALSVLPLIDRLRREHPDLALLVTTGTLTSGRLLEVRLPQGVIHQYVPVDRRAWVRRFLDHWRPDAAIWIESELWPNLVAETGARAVPMALINGRMSESSFKRWRLMKSHVAPLLGAFDVVLGQDETQASRFRALGASGAKYVGNLKYAAPPLPVDERALAELRDATAGRPLWLASSTHPGEEAMIADVHARLKQRFPHPLTIVVPRHPQRGPEVAALFARRGLAVARRSADQALRSSVDAYVADGIGELGLFYRLAPVAFVGGSLVPIGGHNPLEPAQLSSAILMGPHTFNFELICERLAGAGGLRRVADADELADAVGFLLADEVGRYAMTLDAARVARAEAHVLDAIMHALEPLLEPAGPAEAAGARA